MSKMRMSGLREGARSASSGARLKLPKDVMRAIFATLVPDSSHSRPNEDQVRRRSVIYNLGRREHVMRSLGMPVLFYPKQMRMLRETNEKVHLYIDVSGSMLSKGFLALIFAMSYQLQDYIGPSLYQFTTIVRAVTLEELRLGQLITGGTSINAVFEHALKRGHERILVITDGMFELPGEELQRRMKKAKMTAMMISTERVYDEESLREVFADVVDLSELLEQYEREQMEAQDDGSDGEGTGLEVGDPEDEEGEDADSREASGEAESQHPMPRPVDLPIGCRVSVRQPQEARE